MIQGSDQLESAEPVARLTGVSKSFGRQAVLRGVDLEFSRSRTTVVIGPSGCGKTVMLKHIIGLLRPDAGEVWFEDRRVDTLNEARLADIRRQVGFLFQQSALFDSMTVYDNVAFPLVEHTDLNRAQQMRRTRRVLRMVGLTDAIQKMPADLSGGQRKRIALARAIVLEPKLVLYDEPTTGLDPIRADVINELILKLQNELRISSIVVTHDLTSAFKIADDLIMLHEGSVILQGSVRQFQQSGNPIVQKFLQGEATADELAGIRSPAHAPPTHQDTFGDGVEL